MWTAHGAGPGLVCTWSRDLLALGSKPSESTEVLLHREKDSQVTPLPSVTLLPRSGSSPETDTQVTD